MAGKSNTIVENAAIEMYVLSLFIGFSLFSNTWAMIGHCSVGVIATAVPERATDCIFNDLAISGRPFKPGEPTMWFTGCSKTLSLNVRGV